MADLTTSSDDDMDILKVLEDVHHEKPSYAAPKADVEPDADAGGDPLLSKASEPLCVDKKLRTANARTATRETGGAAGTTTSSTLEEAEMGQAGTPAAQPGAFACAPTSGSFSSRNADAAAPGDSLDRPDGDESTTALATDGGGEGPSAPGGLTTANPVEELPVGRVENPSNQARSERDKTGSGCWEANQRIVFLGIGAVALVLVGVVVLVLVVVGKANENDPAPTTDVPYSSTLSTLAPTAQGDYLLKLLPSWTVDAIHSDPDSPQAKAFRWLTNDPQDYSDERLVQRFALATLFFATGGTTAWFHSGHWLSYTHECDWWSRMDIDEFEVGTVGFDAVHYDPGPNPRACGSFEDGLYQHLWLWDNHLEGSLPEELWLLTSLKSLYLSNNPSLAGTLSTRIGNMKKLEALGLYTNSLTGSIPNQIGLLSNLTLLSLHNNQLTGSIPIPVGALEDLEYLVLDGNLLSGPIPSQLGLLQKTVTLFLDTNQLSSQIPTQLGNMVALQEVAIDENRFTGPIPTQLGRLEKLWMLHLADNRLTSTIPSQIGRLSNLNALVVRYNQLTGSIPTQLGLLESSWAIDILDNQITGKIPTEFGLLSTFRGEEPSDPWGTQYHYRGWIIPSEIHLNGNRLSGTIPTQLGLLRAINVVSLQNNQLSGTIPTQLGLLHELTSPFIFPGRQPRPGLDISNNPQITGPIPSELGSLASIVGMDLSNCSLTDTIPSELGQLSSITILTLAHNHLLGNIPSELGALAQKGSLSTLDLSSNSLLAGQVPPGLCSLLEEAKAASSSSASSLAFDCSPLLCGCQCDCNGGEEEVAINTTGPFR